MSATSPIGASDIVSIAPEREPSFLPAFDQTTDVPTLGVALAYAGFRVFPAAIEKKDDGSFVKKPSISGWQDRATLNPTQIRKWAKAFRGGGFGIYCQGSGIVALDIDVKGSDDGLATLAALERELGISLQDTMVSESPSGGLHLLFRSDREFTSTVAWRPGIDIRSRGAWIGAPGSDLGKGPYKLINNVPPAPLPEALAELLIRPRSSDRATPTIELDDPLSIRAARAYLETAGIAKQGSGGDARTIQVANRVIDFGLSIGEAHHLLSEEGGWNARCDPPWDLPELQTKVQNAWASRSNPVGCASPLHDFEGLEEYAATLANGANDNAPAADTDSHKASKGKTHFRPWPRLDDASVGAHYLAAEPEDIPCTIQNIVPGREVTVLSGQGGIGKSNVALLMMAAVASGRAFANLRVRQGTAVGVFTEDRNEILHKRSRAIWHHMRDQYGVDPADHVRRFIPRSFRGTDYGLWSKSRLNDKFYDFLRGAVLAHDGEARLLVLDNASRLYLGDRNDGNEVQQFITVLENLADECDVSVLLLTHVSKAAMSDPSRTDPTGATAWTDMARSQLALTRPAEKTGGSGILLRHAKANNSAPENDIPFVWKSGLWVPDNDLPSFHLQRVKYVFDFVRNTPDSVNLSLNKRAPNYIPRECAVAVACRQGKEEDASFVASHKAKFEEALTSLRRDFPDLLIVQSYPGTKPGETHERVVINPAFTGDWQTIEDKLEPLPEFGF